MSAAHQTRFAPERPTISALVSRASAVSRVPENDIYGPSRRADVCRPRFAVMAAALRHGYPLARIGARLGGRDHTTIINGTRRAKALAATDPAFAAMVEAVAGEGR